MRARRRDELNSLQQRIGEQFAETLVGKVRVTGWLVQPAPCIVGAAVFWCFLACVAVSVQGALQWLCACQCTLACL